MRALIKVLLMILFVVVLIQVFPECYMLRIFFYPFTR